MPTPAGMFDPNMRMSLEDQVVHGVQQTQSPAIRKHATFGEEQMNLHAVGRSREDELRADPRYQEVLKS